MKPPLLPFYRTALTALALCVYASALPAKSLNDLYQLAKNSEPGFQIANLERDAVRERRAQAQSAFKPSASAQANYGKGWNGELENSGSNSGYTVSLNYQIYNRSRDIVLTQTERAIEKTEANYRNAEQGLMLQVAQLYFTALRAVDDLVFSRVAKEAIGKQLEQSRQRFDVGLIAITDVQESQAGYDLAIANEIQAQNALDNAYEALRELVGEYHQDLDILTDAIDLARPNPEDMEKWVENALQNNPALASIQYDVAIAQEGINLRRSESYPTLGVTASHGYADQRNGAFRSHGIDNSVALALQMPFDLSGRLGAQTREALIQHNQALDRLEQQRRQVQRSTRDAYLNLLSGISRVKALKQAVVSNETAYSATLTGFDVGTRTSVDVLNARQALLNAQRNYASARYSYLTSSLSLKQSAGLLQEEDMQKLGALLEAVPADKSSLEVVETRIRGWEQAVESRREEETKKRLAVEEEARKKAEAEAAAAAKALEEQNKLDPMLDNYNLDVDLTGY